MSAFKEVSKFNEVFGKPKGCALDNRNHALVQTELLAEEFAELIEAIDRDDIKEIRDGICDVLVIAMGMGHICGIDVDADMKEVQRSNMSKLCKTHDEAWETVQHYDKLGIHVYTEGDEPEIVVKSALSQSDINGKYYPEGKFLKSINFKEPCFE